MNKSSSQTAGTLGIDPPEKSPASPEEAAPHSQLFNQIVQSRTKDLFELQKIGNHPVTNRL